MPGAHISCLRVKAFKSVGSAWLEVQFHTGLSILVGANGCGKSTLLDALRFAAACPATSLGVGRLADLHNADCEEVRLARLCHSRARQAARQEGARCSPLCTAQACEVQLAVAEGRKVTWVAAALTPDGLRAFRLGGKLTKLTLKTGKEVKVACTPWPTCKLSVIIPAVEQHLVQEYLRDRGILLDRASVIKQAKVTALADCNCAARLTWADAHLLKKTKTKNTAHTACLAAQVPHR